MAKREADPGDETPQFPEMEDPEYKDLIAAAKALKRQQKAFSEAGEDMKLAQEKVKKIMHERELKTYKFGSLRIDLVDSERIKVKVEDE